MFTFNAGQQIWTPGQKQFDQASSTILYVGEAICGASESDATWRIQRITFDVSGNPVKSEWASRGSALCKWDDRTTLEYS